jgi:sulfate adenylyltransferase large subunit
MSAQLAAPGGFNETAFRAFVDTHLDQEMLRFITCGSVDDGKSTLIGRLLHDTKSIYEDQLASITASRVNRAGKGLVDLSLLTDGLRAEREQGITIDVAYRYFSTSRRKFIIADTPGHEQYTRNMATGASTADAAVVLLDAKAFLAADGLLPQSRRHSTIASLLRIPHVVAAVNKMDLVSYSEDVFRRIEAEFAAWCARLGLKDVQAVPVSALAGDNVVEASSAMPWYSGPTLLEYLETAPMQDETRLAAPLRFPVQLVVRPDAGFRGFAGRIESGELHPGDAVKALPSGRVTQVKRLVTWDGDLGRAFAPQSVTVELADEIDLSRGDMLVAAEAPVPSAATRLHVHVVWMNEEPLVPGRTYLAKHTTRTVRVTVTRILHRLEINSGDRAPAESLGMNDIAELELESNLPLFFEPYARNRALGSFILIDSLSNATVGAAMIIDAAETSQQELAAPLESGFGLPRATLILLPEDSAALQQVQAALSETGLRAVSLDDPGIAPSSLPSVLRALQLAGAVALASRSDIPASLLDAVRLTQNFLVLESVDQALRWSREEGSSR